MGARGQSPFGSKFCPGYRIVPAPEYVTEFTALAPVALSAACRRLAASCAAAGAINAADVSNNVPSLIFITLLPELVPTVPNPDEPESRSAKLSWDMPVRRPARRQPTRGDGWRKAALLSDRDEFSGVLRRG